PMQQQGIGKNVVLVLVGVVLTLALAAAARFGLSGRDTGVEAATTPAAPAPAQAQAPSTPSLAPGAAAAELSDLDRLLAPIALYPDALLAQMLMCASDPVSVTSLHQWLEKTKSIKGSALQEAASKAGYEPSFVAMTLFPQVVKDMAEQIDWT